MLARSASFAWASFCSESSSEPAPSPVAESLCFTYQSALKNPTSRAMSASVASISTLSKATARGSIIMGKPFFGMSSPRAGEQGTGACGKN